MSKETTPPAQRQQAQSVPGEMNEIVAIARATSNLGVSYVPKNKSEKSDNSKKQMGD